MPPRSFHITSRIPPSAYTGMDEPAAIAAKFSQPRWGAPGWDWVCNTGLSKAKSHPSASAWRNSSAHDRKLRTNPLQDVHATAASCAPASCTPSAPVSSASARSALSKQNAPRRRPGRHGARARWPVAAATSRRSASRAGCFRALQARAGRGAGGRRGERFWARLQPMHRFLPQIPIPTHSDVGTTRQVHAEIEHAGHASASRPPPPEIGRQHPGNKKTS